jgi:hypothetical protein
MFANVAITFGAPTRVAPDRHRSVLFERPSSKEVGVAFTGPMRSSAGRLTLQAELPSNGELAMSFASLRSAQALGRAWLFRELS